MSVKLPKRYAILEVSHGAVAPRKIALLILCLALPVAIGLAAWLDRALVLPREGVGLVEHYGIWALFTTTPIIILLTARLLGHFLATLRQLDGGLDPSVEPGVRDRFRRFFEQQEHSLCLRGRSGVAFDLLVLSMAFAAIVNMQVAASGSSYTYYGRDTFDSVPHWWGYYTTRTYLLFVSVSVYAIAIFVSLHVTASMIRVFRMLYRANALQVDFLDADNCGGTARFGTANKYILAIYACLGFVSTAMGVTYGRAWFSLAPSVLLIAIAALVQTLGGVYHIHLAIVARKRQRLEFVSARLREAERGVLEGGPFPTDLLAYRDHLLRVKTYPYATSTAETNRAVSTRDPVQEEPNRVTHSRRYDVCFSFAGEDRTYVSAVAAVASAHGLQVFYDAYEAVELWGKDLYQHLTDVYQKRAAFCVVFISRAYATKLWPKHELRAAQARAFVENSEYILPARFDDTEIPGILPTTSYIDLTTLTPAQFGELLIQKVRPTCSDADEPSDSAR